MEFPDSMNLDLGLLDGAGSNWEFGSFTSNSMEIAVLGPYEQQDTQVRNTSETNAIDLTAPMASHDIRIEPETSRRINRAEWEMYRTVIEAEHSSKTLTELREFMVLEHGFIASTQQWKKKLAEWHLGKNLRPHVTRFIRRRALKRQANEKKGTQFMLGGQLIPMDKVNRHLQGPPLDNPSSPTGSTPTDISYCTYKPPVMVLSRLNPPSNMTQQLDREMSPATTISAPSTGITDIGPLIPALWEGHDANYFLARARTAASFVVDGDYPSAKLAFIEALEGLGVLFGPVHAQTIKVLENLVEEAIFNDDLPTALDKLYKSHNAHKDILGAGDRRTWQSLVRLGEAYMEANDTNQAYHMLLNARQGLLSVLSPPEPENVFNSTQNLTHNITDVLIRQDDFAAAEKELLNLISLAESLGEAYSSDVTDIKCVLGSMYLNARLEATPRLPLVSPQQLENLLLEVAQSNSLPRHNHLWARHSLCAFYYNNAQDEKLLKCLQKTKKDLENAYWTDLMPLRDVLFIKLALASSFCYLGRYDEAEQYYFHIQSEIDSLPQLGIHQSTFVLVCLGDQAGMYFKQGRHDNARENLRKALSIAEKAVPRGHQIHARLKFATDTGEMPWVCPFCLETRSEAPDSSTSDSKWYKD